MKKIIYFIMLLFTCGIFCSYASAQIQDPKISAGQLARLKEAKENVKKLKNGSTYGSELEKMFGKESGVFVVEKAATKEDEKAFNEVLNKHIPAQLKPEYPLPTIDQTVFLYIIPWVSEQPVTRPDGKGEYMKGENLVLLVTINKKTGLVQNSKAFDFNFNRKWENPIKMEPIP